MIENLVVPLQEASKDIWDQKYRLRDSDGKIIDQDIDETFERIAIALSDCEVEDKQAWRAKFIEAMHNGALPAGRIMANAGSFYYKSSVSTINCTVSGYIPDTMTGILGRVHEAGLTLKAGCGIGYEFSTLRPRGAYVSGAGATTSGPLSFMDIYDKMCFTISSAGGRRGAQMATFDIQHPDVLDYIKAKREDGRLRQFNMSLLVNNDFMRCLERDEDWPLVFPVTTEEVMEGKIGLDHLYWRSWPINQNYVMDANGLIGCKIYDWVPARKLWEDIMHMTYNYAEPGIIFIDNVNHWNNNWFCEDIRATNPCVTGDTPILTDKGWVEIESVAGEKVNVWNGEEFSEVKPKITGENQRIVNIELSDGSNLKCTYAHKFVLADGGKVEARELVLGDKLARGNWPVIELEKEDSITNAYTQGFFQGDGWTNKESGKQYIGLWEGKKQLLEELGQPLSVHEYDIKGGYEGTNLGKTKIYLYYGRNVFKDKYFVPLGCTLYSRLEWLFALP